jgi:hypothetical protein
MKKDQDKHGSAPVWQEGLKMISHCLLCKFQFGEEAIKIIEERAETHLVHMTCPKCLSAVMAVVMVSEIGMGTVGTFTDLAAEEVMRLKKKGVISEDDILSFYSFVEKQKDWRPLLK